MTINALLHLHAGDDKNDYITYSFEQALKEAKEQGMHAVALTCHNTFTSKDMYQTIADKYGILFISGVEKVIEKRDVVILNCDKSIENVHTFEALHIYKQTHPNCFIIAPHPYFPGGYSLQEKLEQHKECFDAIEFSWFYTKYIDFNKKAQLFAEQNSLPYIATPDAHRMKYLCSGYVSIEAFEFSESALFDAIRQRKYKNISKPKKLWRLFFYMVGFRISRIGKRKKSRKAVA
ncbi:MAG: Uncharacterized protein LiPW41_362 [Parcubacteria group bacterium LiPW_41]|nr:MAG: Uncharacterized protein LiPW41_362 [Parcubacteria group bacterium LiPW_41]